MNQFDWATNHFDRRRPTILSRFFLPSTRFWHHVDECVFSLRCSVTDWFLDYCRGRWSGSGRGSWRGSQEPSFLTTSEGYGDSRGQPLEKTGERLRIGRLELQSKFMEYASVHYNQFSIWVISAMYPGGTPQFSLELRRRARAAGGVGGWAAGGPFEVGPGAGTSVGVMSGA